MSRTIYLVTITDYEASTILGAYSTEAQARVRVDELKPRLAAFGRYGPFIVPMVLDRDVTVYADGDSYVG